MPPLRGPLTKTSFDPAPEPKAFFEVDGASHVDLYDKDEYVSIAVDQMHRFFLRHAA